MTPFLNKDYETMHTKSDMVLVNMWPWERKRRLERGMIVTFRWVVRFPLYSVSDSASPDMELEYADGMVVLGRLLILNTPPSSGLSVSPVIGLRLVNRA